MTTAARKRALLWLSHISFPGYTFEVHGDFTAPTYLQASFVAACNNHPSDPIQQKTRKWLLSGHMTRSELIQTAFKCVLTSIEHEAREQFKYRDAAIFGPHFYVDDLVTLCEKRELDMRGGRA